MKPFVFFIITAFTLIHMQAAEHFKALQQKEAQAALLSEIREPYFSQLQAKEIAALTGAEISEEPLEIQRNKIKQTFSDFVRNFTDEEAKNLKTLCLQVDEQYKELAPTVATIPWVFIKVDSQYCGGFLHTREDFIVLPERFTETLSKIDFSQKNNKQQSELINKVCRLLLHEKLHVAQRFHPNKFRELYKKLWGFKHVQGLTTPSDLLPLHLNNPDALDLGFIIELEGQWHWPRVLFKPGNEKPVMGRDFRNHLIPLILKDKNFTTEQLDGVTNLTKFSNPAYQQKFTNYAYKRGGDHPHEIIAYSLEQIAGYAKSEEFTQSDKVKLATIKVSLREIFE